MSKFTYVLPLALLISGAAQAVSDNPWYAGARIGGTHYNNFEGIIKGADDQLDKDDFGGGVFVGYNFVPWFALEGGYTHLGKLKSKVDGGGSFETQGIDLVGKFTWQAMESFDLFAKAGGYGYKVKAGGENKNGFAPTAGVGAEYFFTNNLSTRLEYQYYFDLGDKDKTGRIDAQFYGISLVYGWGAPAPVAVVEPEPVVEAAPIEPVVVQVEPLTELLPFGFDSNALSQADIDRLQPIAQRLVDYPATELFVIGHTDSRGAEAYNQKLSVERADVVAGYLAGHFNIDANRIKTEGRGETQPIATNDNDEGRAQNRRVEVYTPGFEVQQ